MMSISTANTGLQTFALFNDSVVNNSMLQPIHHPSQSLLQFDNFTVPHFYRCCIVLQILQSLEFRFGC